MKFYSEKLDKLFDSPEALEAAELKKTKSKTTEKTDNAEKLNTPTRKELADAVEAADEKLKEAYAHYETARIKAEEVSRKYLEEINSIIDPAQKAVKDAEKNRYEAIRKFNDSYGAYQVTYTGARAADEMAKAINNINTRASKLLRDMFWF